MYMKSIIKGMTLLLAGASFVACSKDVAFDENAQKEAKAQAELQKKFATYESDFVKAFGSIAPGHKWGFDQTTGFVVTTRTAVTSTSEIWVIPENFTHGRRTKEGKAANEVQAAFNTNLDTTLEGFSFENYWLQHVDMPKNVKVSIVALEAFNSKKNAWEKVTNFDGGKNESDFEIIDDEDSEELPAVENNITAESINLIAGLNKSAACTTLMKDMGGAACQVADEYGNDAAKNKMFRVKMAKTEKVKVNGKKQNVTTYFCIYDYYFLPNFSYYKNDSQQISGTFLGIYFDGKYASNNKSSFWVIKIAEAEKYVAPNPIKAEGRVLCEDMGANDFDFNDVVFDAWIMNTGEIKITVVAHGGTLPITIAGREVTLANMSNTGENEADYQEFTIPASEALANEWTSIEAIPVKVSNVAAGISWELTAAKGSAPQKVCVPIGTDYPDEYVKISRVYSPFDEWVSTTDPNDWTYTVNPLLVDGNLGNNK